MAGSIDAPEAEGLFGKKINVDVSCQTLRRLQRAILISGVLLTHVNVRPQSADPPTQLMEQFKLGVSDHRHLAPT
ncbi:hypothetical protein AVEN_175903-1 [Araneus ventricosus]|uniref:Uncharacterized protein n=1 Tax=Araneus ventricosus TaxID=182803 RepID=A0A4Y2ECE6_ARAVE|nr:hypothetical protein AVEN_175903-1 [Araneus ventricosus]